MQASILLPTYNYARYIARAIESVMHQNYPQHLLEVIVIDDGSTDETASVVKNLQQQYPQLQYHYQPNAGKAAATQRGIALAGGDIIFTLDADDWFLPGKIADTMAVFEQYPSVMHVASAANIEWADGRPHQTELLPERLFQGVLNGQQTLRYFFENNLLFGGGSTFSVRASVAKKFEWTNAIDMYTDEWLVIQALLAGDSYFLNEPRSVWYVHAKNYSGAGGEALQQKQQRMKASSACILQLLQQPAYPAWLQQAYALKHAVRCLVWQEAAGNKTPADAWRFLRSQVLSGKHAFSTLRKYHAFNRLLKW